jgi:polysaccharide biosynthesis transport protein
MKDRDQHEEYALSPRRPTPQPAPPASAFDPVDDYADAPPTPAPSKRVSFRLVTRALARHWWQALLLWLLASGGLVTLAYYKVKPSYDALARIRVEIDDNRVFAPNSSAPMNIEQYLENQVQRVTSASVLGSALTEHPELNALPFLTGSLDAEATIRDALRVGVPAKTSLIQVEMSSSIPTEAAQVVNAVVGSYLKLAQATYDASTQRQIDQFLKARDEQKEEVERQRKVVEDMQKRIGAASVESVKDRSIASLERYKQWSDQLTAVEIQAIASKARLDQLRAERAIPTGSPEDEEDLKNAVIDAFYADPRVVALQAEKERAQTKLIDVERTTARNPGDPSRTRLSNLVKEKKDKIDEYWRTQEPLLRKRLRSRPGDNTLEVQIKQAEAELTGYTSQEATLRKRLDEVKVENKAAESDALKLAFASRDLQRAEDVFETILKNLNQLKFEAKSPVARISLDDEAKASNLPKTDRRKQAMIAAPLVVGLLVVGLFVMLELRGGRVADPDELATRVNLPIIGVVPPLPKIRLGGPAGTPATRGDFRAQRELDEFIQSLDHLRVALCARRDPWGRDRHCVLITSACGSEGKTTLAAQLAERCVNAGLMTLLIDADLRNPTLSRMLDANDNAGLINVLRGEAMPEDVVMVIGDAGGFHLLPAGVPRVDPSRLLQSDRLGKLLAQARESFDMIIVDAPPVLPVPDALTIGRWTDGAVLAVRYDTSRFPLVERAKRRLAHVGVPVIGVVVNGVRTPEAVYGYGGYYGYAYGQSPSADPASSSDPTPPSAADSASSRSSILDD